MESLPLEVLPRLIIGEGVPNVVRMDSLTVNQARYFAIERAKLGHYPIAGPDIRKTFVEIAQNDATEAGVRTEFRRGSVSNAFFASNQFDFVFCQPRSKTSRSRCVYKGIEGILKAGGRALNCRPAAVSRISLGMFSRIYAAGTPPQARAVYDVDADPLARDRRGARFPGFRYRPLRSVFFLFSEPARIVRVQDKLTNHWTSGLFSIAPLNPSQLSQIDGRVRPFQADHVRIAIRRSLAAFASGLGTIASCPAFPLHADRRVVLPAFAGRCAPRYPG